MTDKERSEEIKSVSEFQIDNDSYYGRPANVTLNGDDVKWLIEQAGIGINTSRDKRALIKSNIALNKRVQELEDIIYKDERQAVLEGLYEQNKRYREALEFYADEENYKPFDGVFLSSYQNRVDEDSGKKARQALKEGEE